MRYAKNRRVRLSVDRLESRDVPSTVLQNFDAAPLGGLPAGWVQSGSNLANFGDATPFRVVRPATPIPTSPANALAFDSVYSNTLGRAWSTAAVGPDATAEVNVLMGIGPQARVIARGSALDTAAPTYYAATIVGGSPRVGLVKVVGGVETPLAATVGTPAYLSGKWARLTLDVTGPTVRVQVQRLDAGPDAGKYLNAAGQWVADATGDTWAVTATDAEIDAGTLTGIGRQNGSADPTYFDDFAAGPSTPPVPPGPTVRFAADSYVASESEGAARVRVVLSQPLTTELAVTYFTEGFAGAGAATAGADYVAIPSGGNVLTFLPGETEKTFTVPVYWDDDVERDEFVNLRLGTASSSQAVAVQATPARLTIRDASRDSVVVIDKAWLTDPANLAVAGDPSGPYRLGLAKTTYLLDTDVTKPGTAFVTTAADVSLNLNWHTVTYGTGDYNGDGTSDLAALPNGGFDLGLPGDPTRPRDWDVSGVPSARLTAARTGMYGQMLTITDLAGDRTIVSAPVALPAANRQYAATVTGLAPYRSARKLTLEVVDAATGATLATATNPFGNDAVADAGETGRGFSAVAVFNAPAGTTAVRLRVTVSLDAAVPAALRTDPLRIDLDYAGVFFAQDFGVMASPVGNYGLPPQLQNLPGSRAAERFTLTHGNVVQGGAAGYFSVPLFFRNLDGATADGVRSVVTGPDTHNLYLQYAANVAVRDSTFDARYAPGVNPVSNRQRHHAAVFSDGTSGEMLVAGNTILHAPMLGIKVTNHAGNAGPVRILGNEVRQTAVVADGYGILVNKLSNFEIGHNLIRPESGRGIILDAYTSGTIRDGEIYGNVVESYERPMLEYDRNGIEATALRLRTFADGVIAGVNVRDNTFAARTDAQGAGAAIGLRLSFGNNAAMAGSGNVFERNTFRATVAAASGDQAYAVSVSSLYAGSGLLFRDNVFESNHRTLNLGDRADSTGSAVQDLLMVGNAYVRSPDAAVSPTRADFRAVVAGEGNSPATSVRLFGQRFGGGIADAQKEPLFAGSKPQDVHTGWLVTVAARAAVGPLAGATVEFFEFNAAANAYRTTPYFTGATDAAGRLVAPVVTRDYAYPGSGPSQVAPAAHDRFKVRVTHAGRVLERSDLSFGEDTTLPAFVF